MKYKICIVVSTYYPTISNELVKGALNTLKINNLRITKIITTTGIFEIPVVISRNIKKYDAFIALGCVIKGKTPHFKLISEATTNSIMEISISSKKPIGNGIITCLNKKQAVERSKNKNKNKGTEAARGILSVLDILKK